MKRLEEHAAWRRSRRARQQGFALRAPARRAALGHCALALIALALGVSAGAAPLAVGDTAPDFALEGTDGATWRLSELLGADGVEAVVLAWFPKAYTRGCTIECKSLADNGHLLQAFDIRYFMASTDPIEDNAGFAAENKADFPLLSDPTKAAAEAYGVLTRLGFAARHTFYIGKNRVILAIDRNVRPATSAEDMASKLEALGVARRAPAAE